MRIAILGKHDGWHGEQLQRAAHARGHEATLIDFRRLHASVSSARQTFEVANFDLHDADAVLVRGIPGGSLEQVVFRMDALHRLERAGVRVVNPAKSIEASVDKYLTTSRLQSAGLPIPRTFVCENRDDALAGFELLGGDVVLKPIFGSEGRGILRLDSRPLAERVLATVCRLQEIVYLQEFIPHPGYDVRALVVGTKVIASMKRVGGIDFRTNISQGAVAVPIELPESWKDLALRAATALGTPIAGVDLLPGKDGDPVVLEVNSVPGFQAIAAVSPVDIADEMIAWLEQDRREP